MSRILIAIYFGAFITFFAACKKDNAKEDSRNFTSIIGTWELRQLSAAMWPTNNYLPGNGNILKFTNADYETFENGQLVKNGQYAIIKDTTVEENVCLVLPGNEYTNRIIYDSNYIAVKKFIQISNNKLTIISGCYALDAGSTLTYERQESNR